MNKERKGKYRENESLREMRVSCHMVVKGVNLSKLCVFIFIFWVLTKGVKFVISFPFYPFSTVTLTIKIKTHHFDKFTSLNTI